MKQLRFADPLPSANTFAFTAGAVVPGLAQRAADQGPAAPPASGYPLRTGIIFNGRAHGNLVRERALPERSAILDWARPATRQDLSDALARFARRKIDVLVIDGGDGTIRDTLSEAAAQFPNGLPRVAIVPSGKTNALAIDLGLPRGWTIADALAASAGSNTRPRAPLIVTRDDDPAFALQGFLFGAGAFVKAVELAQGAHRRGAFHGVAVGMSLVGAIAQTAFARRDNPWRRGENIAIAMDDGTATERPFYLLLASTLERLPLGLKPFGRVRPGLKLLGVDAPPRQILASVPALLAGSQSDWLERMGYHHADARQLRVVFDSGFILDGEQYEGGALTITQGASIDFVVP